MSNDSALGPDRASPRLSGAALARLRARIVRPAYDRAALQTGIVHLGLGAFHRAHQALYSEAAIEAGDRRWGTLGVSLRSAATRDALAPQDNLYTLAMRDGAGERLQIVGALTGCLVAPEDPDGLVETMARADIGVVSLTITEKGYCRDPASGALDERHPDIVHDLKSPDRPRSAIGFIVEALARRRARGVAPFTLLSCDNLPANGEALKRAAARLAQLRDPDLGRFIAGEVASPCTMVDRIVPATSDEDREAVAAATGFFDASPVIAEPFSQWVVEDRFALGRPEWERAGALFVADVAPFELMKLRLLNGAHSTLAYLGYLAGHETIAQTMAAPGFAPFIGQMIDLEVAPTAPAPPGFDLAAYARSLLARFGNPALRHRTAQIAMDGSQKLPQRLLGSIRARLAAGAPFERLALGVAGWMVYAAGIDEKGERIAVRDPLAAQIGALTRGRREARALCDAYMGLAPVFGTDLPADPRFREAARGALARLLEQGAARTLASFAEPRTGA